MAGYAQSQFGENVLVGSGGNVTSTVSNHYGPRDTDGSTGVVKTEGSNNELSFWVDGADIGNAGYKLIAPALPAGATIHQVMIQITEAFVMGGTTPAIEIGTETSEATNGFTISEAVGEVAATVDLTAALSGTWAAPLAAATTIGLALSGTTPTITDAGKMKVIIYYKDVR